MMQQWADYCDALLDGEPSRSEAASEARERRQSSGLTPPILGGRLMARRSCGEQLLSERGGRQPSTVNICFRLGVPGQIWTASDA